MDDTIIDQSSRYFNLYQKDAMLFEKIMRYNPSKEQDKTQRGQFLRQREAKTKEIQENYIKTLQKNMKNQYKILRKAKFERDQLGELESLQVLLREPKYNLYEQNNTKNIKRNKNIQKSIIAGKNNLYNLKSKNILQQSSTDLKSRHGNLFTKIEQIQEVKHLGLKKYDTYNEEVHRDLSSNHKTINKRITTYKDRFRGKTTFSSNPKLYDLSDKSNLAKMMFMNTHEEFKDEKENKVHHSRFKIRPSSKVYLSRQNIYPRQNFTECLQDN